MPLKHLIDCPAAIKEKGWQLYKLDEELFPCSRISLTVSGLQEVNENQIFLNQWLIKTSDVSQNDPTKCQCEKCGKIIQVTDKIEHSDWHVALELSKERIVVPHLEKPNRTQKKTDKKARKVKENQPVQKKIKVTEFFKHLPNK
jgi:hypothetical protein